MIGSARWKNWILYDSLHLNLVVWFLTFYLVSGVVAYSEEARQTSKMERFAKVVNGSMPLTIFVKLSFIDF